MIMISALLPRANNNNNNRTTTPGISLHLQPLRIYTARGPEWAAASARYNATRAYAEIAAYRSGGAADNVLHVYDVAFVTSSVAARRFTSSVFSRLPSAGVAATLVCSRTALSLV